MKLKLVAIAALQIISMSAMASEDTWATAQVKLPSAEGRIDGFKTDSGAFRIDTLPVFSSKLQISGGFFGASNATNAFKCSAVGSSLAQTRKLTKNVFKFKALLYPLAATELKKLPLAIENNPVIGNVVVALHPVQNSIVTEQSTAEFEKKVNDILNANLDKLRQDGEISFELPQVDDVACDLILGQSKLDINFAVHLEMAKHTREVILTSSEFSKVYEDVKSRSVKPVSQASRSLVNGALLDQALRNQLGKSIDDFEIDRYLRIASVVFSPDLSVLQVIPSENYEMAARSVDILRRSSLLVTLRNTLDSKLEK